MIDFVSVIGLVLGIFLTLYGFTMDGGKIHLLWLLSAIVIVFGGSFGSTVLSFGFNQVKMFPKLLLEVFIAPKSKITKSMDLLIKLSDKARKDGVLSLENMVQDSKGKDAPDPFLKKAILMVIDGTDAEEISDILGNEIDIYEKKKTSAITMFDTMAQYAPAYGMIGTIMGLIMLLQDMSSPEQLTKSIAVAFVTTLYGSMAANLLFLPSSRKLRNRLVDYRLEKEMIIEGVCAIRNSVNTRLLKDKLAMYLQFEKGDPNKIKNKK
ncbi:MAG: chemotaxis protein PomA [Clostridia bacterium]|nr:chemotaxis protein PomA [Clostridia bacterium]